MGNLERVLKLIFEVDDQFIKDIIDLPVSDDGITDAGEQLYQSNEFFDCDTIANAILKEYIIDKILESEDFDNEFDYYDLYVTVYCPTYLEREYKIAICVKDFLLEKVRSILNQDSILSELISEYEVRIIYDIQQ
jgi:hypothetical protein